MIQCFHVSLWFALVLILTILSDTDILCNIDCDHNKWLRKLGFELPPHTYNVDCDVFFQVLECNTRLPPHTYNVDCDIAPV